MIDTSLDSSNFYFLLAVIQGFILSLIILLQRPSRKPHLFFGLLIFFFSLALLHLILEESIHAFNAYFPIPMDFGFAYGPLIYFHVLFIKAPLRPFRFQDLAHFLPSLLIDGVFFMAFFIYLKNYLHWAYDNIPLIQSIGLGIALLGTIQSAIYVYWIYRESREAKLVLKEYTEVKKWLRLLMLSFSAFIGFLLLAIPIAFIFIKDLDDNSYLIYKPLGSIVGFCIYLLGYVYLLKYSRVIGKYTERIHKFKSDAQELHEKKDQILKALIDDKLYLDPKITVAKLAGHLGWPINSLSNIINQSLHTNFNDLINYHRVEAFKQKILEPDNDKYSILGLSQEVGFSSKASFYRAFKKETGLTPSDYLKSQR